MIHVYLAGDSTVQTYDSVYAPQAGWGQFIADHFTSDVIFHNHAIGGRSSKTFITEGRLQAILGEIKEGDFLFVQMGHNDSTKSRPERYTEPYAEYKQYLKKYIEGARAKGAIPILFTPVGRLHYVNNEFLADFGDYCNAMKEVAEEESVLLIDLNKKSIEFFTSIGYEQTYHLFMIAINGTDCTHFTEKGGKEIARLVSEEVKKLNIGLSDYVIV